MFLVIYTTNSWEGFPVYKCFSLLLSLFLVTVFIFHNPYGLVSPFELALLQGVKQVFVVTKFIVFLGGNRIFILESMVRTLYL
jgi:hypothetical protein